MRTRRTKTVIAMPAVILVALITVLALAGCDQGRSDTLEDLAEMEPGDGPVSEERIAELRRQIETYREIVDEKVQATGQLGVYYKMLARAYINRRMYGPALDALEEAIRIETVNPVVFYRAGVAAGQLGNAAGSESEAMRQFDTAERYYVRAIELDAEYVDALYGLAVLYTFEFDRPEAALDLLERATTVAPGRARPFMLKGRVLLALERPDAAAQAYGNAAETADSEEIRDAALENRRRILGN